MRVAGVVIDVGLTFFRALYRNAGRYIYCARNTNAEPPKCFFGRFVMNNWAVTLVNPAQAAI